MATLEKEQWLRWVDRVLNVLCALIGCVVVYLLLSVFCFCTFKVPSESMMPDLLPGDQVVVNKMVLGPQLFNLRQAAKRRRVPVYRLPGFGEVRRNDVLVFHDPYPYGLVNRIRMDLLRYFVKRCVGLPGDSLSIRNGYYRVKGTDEPLGDLGKQAEQLVAGEDALRRQRIFEAYPQAPELGWNVFEFGPLYIPRRGDSIRMDRRNAAIYRELIEWEQQGSLRVDSAGVVSLDDKPLEGYRFGHDYYFMAGDNAPASHDSRFWGLLPGEFIVGKVWLTFLL